MWIVGRVVKVCGPRTYLSKTDHLIRARDKVPNELRELGIPVPKLCEQSDLSTARFQLACRSRQSISQIKCRACVHSITSCFAGFAAIRENFCPVGLVTDVI